MTGAPVFLRTTAPPQPGASLQERFQACVRNTGNYFYEESLLRQLPDVQVCAGLEALPRRVPLLVLSMSNFISPATDLGYLHDALRQHGVERVVMIGAGAQAYEYGEAIRLQPGTRRFLHFVADRSRTIGVRGCYTADVLGRLGIRNVEVVGCPSAFWAGDAPRLDGAGALPDRPRLAMHSTPLGHYRDKVSALMAHGMRHGADYVMQSEAWMMPLLARDGERDGERDAEPDSAAAALHENLLFYAYPECDPARLRAWLKQRLLVFFGMAGWLDRMRGYDFVYGSRFHGNMAAIQAGVPALNMPYDTRTRELCEHLNLPVLPLQDFDAGMPVERLRELADFGLYCRTWRAKLAAYADFLTRNGLAHTLDCAPAPAPAATAPGWAVELASLRQLLSDLESGRCGDAALHAALAQRLRRDRDAGGRLAAEEGRLGDIRPASAPGRAELAGHGTAPALPDPAAVLHGAGRASRRCATPVQNGEGAPPAAAPPQANARRRVPPPATAVPLPRRTPDRGGTTGITA